MDIRMLLSCPEDSAGSLMTTEYASLPAGIPAGEAIARLRTQAPNSESIYYILHLGVRPHTGRVYFTPRLDTREPNFSCG